METLSLPVPPPSRWWTMRSRKRPLPWCVARVRDQPTPDRGQALPSRLGAVACAPTASEAHGALEHGEEQRLRHLVRPRLPVGQMAEHRSRRHRGIGIDHLVRARALRPALVLPSPLAIASARGASTRSRAWGGEEGRRHQHGGRHVHLARMGARSSAGPPARSPTGSGGRSPPATAAARTPDATDHRPGRRSTTSSTGNTAGPPPSTTW